MNGIIGFIGLGTMGTPMARCLLQSGFPLIVYDISPEKVQQMTAAGAKPAGTAREVAARATVIISMLPRPENTEAVVLGDDGIIHEFKEGKILIDMSTSSLALTHRICAAVEAKSSEMLDAPVSGGCHGAEKGTLTIMVGGREQTFKKCEPLFCALGKNIHYAGKGGSGHLLKLLNNLLYSINMCAAAEVLTMGEKLGLQLPHMAEVLNAASAGSYCLSEKVPAFILQDDFSAGLKTDLLLKDIGLALEAGENTECLQVFAGLAHQFFKISSNSGLGGEDNSAVIKVFRALSEKKIL